MSGVRVREPNIVVIEAGASATSSTETPKASVTNRRSAGSWATSHSST